jgi:hypothetical protein
VADYRRILEIGEGGYRQLLRRATIKFLPLAEWERAVANPLPSKNRT